MIKQFLLIELALFVAGCFYGLFAGDKNMNIVIRTIWAGLFFAGWLITIPLTYYFDK